MTLQNLFFRDTFEVKADYQKLATYFGLKLNETYFKGYIDKDSTQLFYFSGALSRPLSARLPVVQLNFEDKVDNDGLITIKFKIVDFVLILFALANGVILFLSIVDLNGVVPRVPAVVPSITFTLSYGFLQFLYLTERANFMKDIRQIELRQ